MESDADLRDRATAHFCSMGMPADDMRPHLDAVSGVDLDMLIIGWGVLRGKVQALPPDPFGDAIHAAQEQAHEDEVIPHPVTRPSTPAELDDLWNSIMDVGRGA